MVLGLACTKAQVAVPCSVERSCPLRAAVSCRNEACAPRSHRCDGGGERLAAPMQHFSIVQSARIVGPIWAARQDERSRMEAHLRRDDDDALALDHGNALPSRPLAAFLPPSDTAHDRVGSGVDVGPVRDFDGDHLCGRRRRDCAALRAARLSPRWHRTAVPQGTRPHRLPCRLESILQVVETRRGQWRLTKTKGVGHADGEVSDDGRVGDIGQKAGIPG
jgi:hypothetical protein